MTPEEVYAAISALGSTPEEVADGLRAKGIRGFRQAKCGCPMAVFVNRLLGRCDCEVTRGHFRLTPGLGGHHHLLPRAAREFVISFDAGRFPFLLPERRQ